MILVIDNYDSFTYNLVQYIGEVNPDIRVIRNDECSLQEIHEMKPERIIISPGPGRPENAGVSIDVIKQQYRRVPILGVCLGHQAIGVAFGGRVNQAKQIMHGKVSDITYQESPLFKGIENPFKATRYHSLIITEMRFPKNELDIIARLDNREIMAVQHKEFPLYGIQFHPESILTKSGKQLIRNFLAISYTMKV